MVLRCLLKVQLLSIDCIGKDKTYEFTNCTVNGVKYTRDTYTSFEKIFSRNHVGIKINGIGGCNL